MNKPVWIVSSSVLIILFLFIGFISFYEIKLPVAVPLTAQTLEQTVQAVEPFDPTLIYQNDLFRTYIPPEPTEQLPTVEPIPVAPREVVLQVPSDGAPRFVEPLPVTLTGIMMVNDTRYDRAIIMDNNTKQEINYKVGDIIEDAQVVAIYPQRILLVRSNGQQEYLYLTQEEINKAQERIEAPDWSKIIKFSESGMLVDRAEFAREIINVSRFVDLFDLSTAYKDGKSLGSKIGQIKEITLPYALGFRSNDIIVTVDNLPARTTTERLALLEHFKKLPDNSVVTIDLLRNNRKTTMKLKIGEISTVSFAETAMVTDPVTLGGMPQSEITRQYADTKEQEKQRILQEKYKFAPTANEIEKMERRELASIKRL